MDERFDVGAARGVVPGATAQAATLTVACIGAAVTNGYPPAVDLSWYAIPVALAAVVAHADRRGAVADLPATDRATVAAFSLAGAVGFLVLGVVQVLLLGGPAGPPPPPSLIVVGAPGLGLGGGAAVGLLYARQARAARRTERERERLSEFASAVSHDLRNPLGVARGRLDLARTADDPGEHFAAADEALARMDDRIEQVLSLARGGPETLSTEPVDVATVAREARDAVRMDGTDLDVTGAPTVVADRGRLRQALENLFDNAVEHGDATVVRVGTVDDEGFYVADDGPGIPPDLREAVLERGVSTGGGAGLGLAIVASVADEHGWSVTVTAGDDGGARFEFRPGDDGPPPTVEW